MNTIYVTSIDYIPSYYTVSYTYIKHSRNVKIGIINDSFFYVIIVAYNKNYPTDLKVMGKSENTITSRHDSVCPPFLSTDIQSMQ
jgi:hypothetical protein